MDTYFFIIDRVRSRVCTLHTPTHEYAGKESASVKAGFLSHLPHASTEHCRSGYAVLQQYNYNVVYSSRVDDVPFEPEPTQRS